MFRSLVQNVIVCCLLFWPLQAWSAEGNPRLLRTVGEVRALSPSELAKHPPVSIEGIVTYCEPSWYLTFIQDETGGIYLGTTPNTRLKSGDRVQVSGIAAQGRISAIITGATRVEPELTNLAKVSLPKADLAEVARLEGYDATWIALRGTVRAVRRINDRASIEIDADSRSFTALVGGLSESRDLPYYLLDCAVTVQGVLGTTFHPTGEISGTVLYVPSLREFILDPSDVNDRFQGDLLTYSEIFRGAQEGRLSKARLHAFVTHVQPSRGIFVRVLDKNTLSGSLWVQTSQPVALKVGQRVDLVGTPQYANRKPWLKEAMARVIGDGAPTPPERFSPATISAGDFHGSLVTIEGTLVEQRQGLLDDSLILLADNTAVCVRLEVPAQGARLPSYEKGSQLRVVGTVIFPSPPAAELDPPAFSFQLWPRSPEDISMLSRPPWWTARRMLLALGGALTIASVAIGWVAALRRRVATQTTAMRGHLERQTLQEERMRVAREFHDTFEQQLIGIGLTLQTAEAASGVPPQVRELLREAAEMARHTRHEAKHAIWELRTGGIAASDLLALIRNELASSAQMAGVELRLEAKGNVRVLPAVIQNHLLRIAQESFTNALKHSHAGQIAMELHFGPTEVVLTVSDNGAGFETAKVKTAQIGAFGVAGMRERAVRMNGNFELTAVAGGGTRVQVRVPLPSCQP